MASGDPDCAAVSDLQPSQLPGLPPAARPQDSQPGPDSGLTSRQAAPTGLSSPEDCDRVPAPLLAAVTVTGPSPAQLSPRRGRGCPEASPDPWLQHPALPCHCAGTLSRQRATRGPPFLGKKAVPRVISFHILGLKRRSSLGRRLEHPWSPFASCSRLAAGATPLRGPGRAGPLLAMCPPCWPRYGPPGRDSPLFCVCQTASAMPQSPENTKNTASWRGSGLHSKRAMLQDRWVTAPAGAEGGNRPEVSAVPGRRGPGDAQGASCLLRRVSNVPGNAPNRPPRLEADPERAGRPGVPFTAPPRRAPGGGPLCPPSPRPHQQGWATSPWTVQGVSSCSRRGDPRVTEGGVTDPWTRSECWGRGTALGSPAGAGVSGEVGRVPQARSS